MYQKRKWIHSVSPSIDPAGDASEVSRQFHGGFGFIVYNGKALSLKTGKTPFLWLIKGLVRLRHPYRKVTMQVNIRVG